MNVLADFQRKFLVQELMIFETQHWIWSLRPHQGTFGAGILSLRRECLSFGELTSGEFCDLENIIKVVENTLSNVLQYDVINYLMLMMFDKHVHFHVFPRYEKPIHVLGELWADTNWPGMVDLVGEPLDSEKLQEVVQFIKMRLVEV